MPLKFRWETEFKETEIGEIPREWQVMVLGEIVQVEWGNTSLTKKIYKEIGYPVFSATGQDGFADFFEREGDAIIVSAIGANCGMCFYASGKWTAIKNTLILQNKKLNCNIRFLYYFLNDKEKWPELGSGQPFISQSAAEEVLVMVPPSPEQSRIATVLSWFDDLIENKKKQNEILEKTAMAIFKNWFIDFEPFKDEEFVDSEIGRRPKGWQVKPIGEVADIRNGLSYSGKEKFLEPVEGSLIFITLNNAIEGGGFKPVYSWIKSDRIKDKYLLDEGDLIIPNTEQTKDERLLGSPAIIFFPPDYSGKAVYSHHITGIFTFDKRYRLILYLLLKHTREDSSSFSTGTGVLGMDINNFRKNKLVILPPSSILSKFHALVEPLFQKIINNQKQIMVLRKIRNTLLPLLVFGKLRVEEI